MQDASQGRARSWADDSGCRRRRADWEPRSGNYAFQRQKDASLKLRVYHRWFLYWSLKTFQNWWISIWFLNTRGWCEALGEPARFTRIPAWAMCYAAQQLRCVGSGARLLGSALVLPLPSCVTPGKFLNFSLPWLCWLLVGILIAPWGWGCCKD